MTHYISPINFFHQIIVLSEIQTHFYIPHLLFSILSNFNFLTWRIYKFELPKILPGALFPTQIEPKEPKISKIGPHVDHETGVHMLPAKRCFDFSCYHFGHFLKKHPSMVQPPQITWKAWDPSRVSGLTPQCRFRCCTCWNQNLEGTALSNFTDIIKWHNVWEDEVLSGVKMSILLLNWKLLCVWDDLNGGTFHLGWCGHLDLWNSPFHHLHLPPQWNPLLAPAPPGLLLSCHYQTLFSWAVWSHPVC